MDILKYKTYEAIDLMLDEDFIRYIFRPNPEVVAFWNMVKIGTPGIEEKMEEARLALLSIQPEYHAMDAKQLEKTWDVIAAKTSNPVKKPHWFSSRKMKFATALIGVVILSFLLVLSSPNQYIYVTSFGQSAKVILPDSSEVLLNANSRLAVTERTFLSGLKLHLNGEAYFHIRNHNVGLKRRWCIVETSQARIMVTGTEFNVRSRGSKTQVYLEEGGVNITDIAENSFMQLAPGELAEIETKNKSFLKTKTEAEKYTAWTKGNLSFQQTSLTEVFQLLRDQFGIETNILSPGILNKTFSGQIPGKNPELLLKAIEESFGLDVEWKNNQTISIRIKNDNKE